MFPCYTALENSTSLPWKTRGWTFQEKLLSRRLLLFNDHQVYFKCLESIWTEEVWLETAKLSNSIAARRRKYAWIRNHENSRATTTNTGRVFAEVLLNAIPLRIFPSQNRASEWDYLGQFSSYAAAVQEYTWRDFSDPRDALFAINGVLRTQGSSSGMLLNGLPEAYFLEALLWYPEVGTSLLRTVARIPSWSWAGWSFRGGRASYMLIDLRALRKVDNFLSMSVDSDSRNNNSTKLSELKYPGAFRNLFSCFLPVLITPDVNIKTIAYGSRNQGRDLAFRAPMASMKVLDLDSVKTFDASVGFLRLLLRGSEKLRTLAAQPSESRGRAASRTFPNLSITTAVIRFRIGNIVQSRLSNGPNDVALYELLDSGGRCVGEVWTTGAIASKYERHRIDFLTVTWGFGMSGTQIHPAYLPKWRVTSLPYLSIEARRKCARSMKTNVDQGFGAIFMGASERPRTAGADTSSQNPPSSEPMGKGGMRLNTDKDLRPNQQPDEQCTTAGSLFEALLLAEKGLPRPRGLWTVVNLIAIEWEGEVAHRIGVGRVVWDAWKAACQPARTVILM